jgi:murein DD-endopeptidase MepM/ murein hydrolase activator NlpD
MARIKHFIDFWLWGFFLFVRDYFQHVLRSYLSPTFHRFEGVKDLVVAGMIHKRGRYAQLFVNATLILVMTLGVTVGPSLIVDDGRVRVNLTEVGSKIVFAASEEATAKVLGEQGTEVSAETATVYSEKPRAEVYVYTIEEGDTLSSIGVKFGVSVDTLRWANSEKIKSEKDKIKPGDTLKVPPVTGVVHTVKSGETIYSIAKKYNIDPQLMVDFPFNDFTNDETFALAIGQTLMVPDGVVPDVVPWSPSTTLARVLTPNAGAVSATGTWIWPAQGRITQGFKSWHRAVDIANGGGGAILAADAGVIVVAGWPDNVGYGNRVMIDHGNGYKTLYGHLSKIAVQVGQTVKKGDKIGDMGSTGRSTGTHLHFEIRTTSGMLDPLGVLK